MVQQASIFPQHRPVCMSVLLAPDQPSFPQGQQIYLPLSIFEYVAQDQYTCQKQGSFVLYQLYETNRPVAAPMSLKFTLRQQAYVLHLHSTTWHVGYNCTITAYMSVRVTSYQQICLNELQLTSKHICSCGG